MGKDAHYFEEIKMTVYIIAYLENNEWLTYHEWFKYAEDAEIIVCESDFESYEIIELTEH